MLLTKFTSHSEYTRISCTFRTTSCSSQDNASRIYRHSNIFAFSVIAEEKIWEDCLSGKLKAQKKVHYFLVLLYVYADITIAINFIAKFTVYKMFPVWRSIFIDDL